jgi:hypothetical protein
MLGISLYSYPRYVFLIIAYVFSSTKLEIRAEQVLPGRKASGEGGGRGQGEEMTQTIKKEKLFNLFSY